MKIPLVDLKAQYASIKGDIDNAIQRVVERCSFILGEEVDKFEKAFAAYCGSDGAVGVASGTAALHLALLACRIRPGDEVITAAHTFTATGEAIVNAGAVPVFVDIEPVRYTLSPERVEAAVTPRTRAIIPVHLYGHPAEMDALSEIARKHNLFLIEDAAQAHGATYKGKRCGSIGHLACFSFYPGKNLGAFGDAGMVTGNDQDLLNRVRRLRDHGRTSKYEHEEIGWGERLDALQAAILGVKLPHLDRWNDSRRSLAATYTSLLKNLEVVTPSEQAEAHHVFHLYVIRTRQRDSLLKHLQAAGIGAGIHYPIPLHRQPAYRAYSVGLSLPATEEAADAILSLPLFPEMSKDQLRYVAEAVNTFGRT